MYLSFLYFLCSDHFQHISWRHVVVECQLFQPWNSASQIDGSQWGIYTPHSSICLCCTFITMHNSIIQSIKQKFNNSISISFFFSWKSLFCNFSSVLKNTWVFCLENLATSVESLLSFFLFLVKFTFLKKYFHICLKSQRKIEGYST